MLFCSFDIWSLESPLCIKNIKCSPWFCLMRVSYKISLGSSIFSTTPASSLPYCLKLYWPSECHSVELSAGFNTDKWRHPYHTLHVQPHSTWWAKGHSAHQVMQCKFMYTSVDGARCRLWCKLTSYSINCLLTITNTIFTYKNVV